MSQTSLRIWEWGSLVDPWVRLQHQGSERNLYGNFAGSRFMPGHQKAMLKAAARRKQRINVTETFTFNDFPDSFDQGARQRIGAFIRRRQGFPME